MNNKITVVITTFNRYPCLLRLLRYYASTDPCLKLLVLDSSISAHRNKDIEELLNRENVSYMKFDPSFNIVQKISAGLKHVSTKYCALCADDDFLLPYAILKCMFFLEKSPDYSCARGYIYMHKIIGADKQESARVVFTPNYIEALSINKKTSLERFLDFFPNGYTIMPFYSVHRTKDLSLIWDESLKYTDYWGLSEIFPSCLSLILGKQKLLPYFYSSREINTGFWYKSDNIKKQYSKERLEKAIKGLAGNISQIDEIDFSSAETAVKGQFRSYINYEFSKWKIKNEVLPGPGSVRKDGLLIRIIRRLKWSLLKIMPRLPFSEFYRKSKEVEAAVLTAGIDDKVISKSRESYENM